MCMVQRGEDRGLLVFSFFGGFASGVDGGFVGFCRLDVVVVVVVHVWCNGGGDCGVAIMVDRRLLWFWVFFFFFLVGGCCGVWWWLFAWVLVMVGLGLVVGF